MADPSPPALRALRSELHSADDKKIMRIAAMLDEKPDLPVPDAVLQALRGRLTSLRPARKLRFARLLFEPLNELIVPPLQYRPSEPVIPRTVIRPITAAVRDAMGARAVVIEAMIAGHDTNAIQIVSEAGTLLWPVAAELLPTLPPPADWSQQTGLPVAVYWPLNRAIASVLRRAVPLRRLARDAELGMLEPCERTVREIVQLLPEESPEGCTMVVQQLLGCLPDEAMVTRMLSAAGASVADKTMLKTSLDRGLTGFLSDMEPASPVMQRLRHAPVEVIINQVRRLAQLLETVEQRPDLARHRERLKAIRGTLDDICRARFTEEVQERLVTMLAAAPGPQAGVVQRDMEDCARRLRALETTGRKIGRRAEYDRLLQEAVEPLHLAARAGRLTPGRQARLLEILSGPEAAEAWYREHLARAAAGR